MCLSSHLISSFVCIYTLPPPLPAQCLHREAEKKPSFQVFELILISFKYYSLINTLLFRRVSVEGAVVGGQFPNKELRPIGYYFLADRNRQGQW